MNIAYAKRALLHKWEEEEEKEETAARPPVPTLSSSSSSLPPMRLAFLLPRRRLPPSSPLLGAINHSSLRPPFFFVSVSVTAQHPVSLSRSSTPFFFVNLRPIHSYGDTFPFSAACSKKVVSILSSQHSRFSPLDKYILL